MSRFADILDRKLEEFERPPNLPTGHYIWQITKHPEYSEFTSRDGVQLDRVTFVCNPLSPMEDVDEDELSSFGDYTKTFVRKSFLVPDSSDDAAGHERSLFMIRTFLSYCGIDESLPMGEAMSNSINGQFAGELTHRPDPNNPEVVYQEIGRTSVPE